MSFFEKLKQLFSGSSKSRPGSDPGLYFYIRLKRGGEIVRLRLNPQAELVPDYDEGGYFTRKTVVGPKTYQRAEAEFRFDDAQNLTTWDISGGELVSQEDWEAQQAQPAQDE